MTHLFPWKGQVAVKFPWTMTGQGEMVDPTHLLKVFTPHPGILPDGAEEPVRTGEHGYDSYDKTRSEKLYGKSSR